LSSRDVNLNYNGCPSIKIIELFGAVIRCISRVAKFDVVEQISVKV